jgi:hypothetical protein
MAEEIHQRWYLRVKEGRRGQDHQGGNEHPAFPPRLVLVGGDFVTHHFVLRPPNFGCIARKQRRIQLGDSMKQLAESHFSCGVYRK